MLALDIETDTSPLTQCERDAGYTARGLDPAITPIISYATHDGVTAETVTGSETYVLAELAALFGAPRHRLLVTWNGACFDFPFLHARMTMHGMAPPFAMTYDRALVPKYGPTPGYTGGYQITGERWSHTDIAYVVRGRASRRGIPWSLKPYAKALGLHPVEVDRSRMHTLTEAELREYNASDAEMTWRIAFATLGTPTH